MHYSDEKRSTNLLKDFMVVVICSSGAVQHLLTKVPQDIFTPSHSHIHSHTNRSTTRSNFGFSTADALISGWPALPEPQSPWNQPTYVSIPAWGGKQTPKMVKKNGITHISPTVHICDYNSKKENNKLTFLDLLYPITAAQQVFHPPPQST